MSEVMPVVEERQVKTEVVGDAAIILNLEEMIKNYASSILHIKEEKKKHQEMFADGFANNPVYREKDQEVKDVTKERSAVKQQIASTPSMIAINIKIKGLSQDLKERQLAFSDYLIEYQRLTGANQLELFEGETFDIVNSAKVIKHSSRG